MPIPLFLATLAAQACPAPDAALPPPLAAWIRPAARLAVGSAATLATAAPASPNAAHPGRVAAADFTVQRAGTYRIALDQPGWIDVAAAAGGAPLASVAHGHGPACSTIRKLVGFRLAPGRYRLSLSGLQRPAAKVMLVAED